VADRVTQKAANGTFADGQIGGNLVVAVPVLSSEDVVGVARASVTLGVVWRRVILAWLVLAALAVASLVVARSWSTRRAGSATCTAPLTTCWPWRETPISGCLRRPTPWAS